MSRARWRDQPPLDNSRLQPPHGHQWCPTCRGFGSVPTGRRVTQAHPYPDQPPTRAEWGTCQECGGRCWVPLPGHHCEHCQPTGAAT